MNKVAAHTGILENEKADKLAKEFITLDTVGNAHIYYEIISQHVANNRGAIQQMSLCISEQSLQNMLQRNGNQPALLGMLLEYPRGQDID
ncbi:hypothetical protein G9A89_011162 [Geosiphon pyriformis]|nr:hypothetical protein G9A89_011162 [Geosiphon pyriformis]